LPNGRTNTTIVLPLVSGAKPLKQFGFPPPSATGAATFVAIFRPTCGAFEEMNTTIEFTTARGRRPFAGFLLPPSTTARGDFRPPFRRALFAARKGGF
jgi:hypothetical protein